MIFAFANPPKGSVYDIEQEQLRAQGQAIYESYVMRLLGKKHFRDLRTGRRIDLDLDLDPEVRREMISAYLFAAGTRVAQRTGYAEPGTRTATSKAKERSRERTEAAWADALLRNRQDYEETLALARKGPFYRVVPERTQEGVRYFVWPMPPGVAVPGPGLSEAIADVVAAKLNAERDPRRTGRYWTPPKLAYEPEQLEHWLPPVKRERATRRKRGAA